MFKLLIYEVCLIIFVHQYMHALVLVSNVYIQKEYEIGISFVMQDGRY